MRRLYAVGVLCVLVVLLAACSVSTANISKAELARGYQDGQAVDVVTSFQPTDTSFHLVVTLNNAPSDTKVKALWTAVDADDGSIKDQKLDETELTAGGGVLDFTLKANQDWPQGKYKVDLYMNEKLDRSVDFTVE